MRNLKFLSGFFLIGVAAYIFGLENERHSTLALSAGKYVCLLFGAMLLNRAMTNRPVFASKARNDQMLRNARQKWQIGVTAVGLFILSLLIAFLGTPLFFGYNRTNPTLTEIAIIIIGTLGGFQLWRYLKFVKCGIKSDSNS